MKQLGACLIQGGVARNRINDETGAKRGLDREALFHTKPVQEMGNVGLLQKVDGEGAIRFAAPLIVHTQKYHETGPINLTQSCEASPALKWCSTTSDGNQ